MGIKFGGAPRRENDSKRTFNSTPQGLDTLKSIVAASQASNAEFKADPWNNVGAAQRNNYREPMASVTQVAAGSKKA
jgi:hypothetical protein